MNQSALPCIDTQTTSGAPTSEDAPNLAGAALSRDATLTPPGGQPVGDAQHTTAAESSPGSASALLPPGPTTRTRANQPRSPGAAGQAQSPQPPERPRATLSETPAIIAPGAACSGSTSVQTERPRVIVRRGRTFTYPPEQLIDNIVGLWKDRKHAQQVAGDHARYLQSVCRSICTPDHAEEIDRCYNLREIKKTPDLVKDGRALYLNLIARRPKKVPHPRLAQALAIDPEFLQWHRMAVDKVSEIEKRLEPLAEQLPVWAGWARDVPGLGAISVLGVVAECPEMHLMIDHHPKRGWLGPSKVWKRFGLAVINGRRQHKTRDKDEAEEQGLCPRRKALAYVISGTLVQYGSPYRAVYLRERAKKDAKLKVGGFGEDPSYLAAFDESSGEWKPGHAHAHALGCAVKQCLVDFWRVWHGFNCRPSYDPQPTTGGNPNG